MESEKKKRFMVARVNTLEQYSQPATNGVEPKTNGDARETSPISTSPQGRVTRDETVEEAEEEDEVANLDEAACQKTWAHLSLRYLTRDVLPKLEHYRNLQSIVGRTSDTPLRPTLEYLHNPSSSEDCEDSPLTVIDDHERNNRTEESFSNKFGWIKGVFVRCLLNIWGVMLFLRLPWVTAQAGILGAVGIVLGANLVTTITALSMSAISTNGQIRGGGTYFMISRSLGPEFGGAIGLIFSFANAVASSMYIVGFCESLIGLLDAHGLQIIDGGLNDTRIIGSITLVVLFVICILGGMAWEAITQMGLLVILLLAMVDVIVGVILGPTTTLQMAQGYLGFNNTLAQANLYPDFRVFEGEHHSFFTVFAVFFPACTGILAGANISGDLKDPSSAIPKGTLLAILVTFISYVLFIVLIGVTVARDATGVVEAVTDWTFLNCSFVNTTTGCQFGTHNSVQVLELVSYFSPLIYAGCFAATLSSALASLVSAPKVFQALCKDKLFPFIEFFGKGYGKSEEPYRAYALTLVIALVFIAIGALNAIASIISNFFLAAYALINFSCFHSSYQKSPGWRPTFKYYNMWLSLAGSILCVVVMFLSDWRTALLTYFIMISIYYLVAFRKLNINWGSSVQSESYRQAMTAVFALDRFEDHVKTFRPQILLFCGDPSDRPPLVHFAHSITKNSALLVVAECSEEEEISYRNRVARQKEANKWLQKEKIKAFYSLANAPRMDKAAAEMMAIVGLGRLKPNIVMLGFKYDWANSSSDSLQGYFGTIHSALDLHFSVCILRTPEKMNFSDIHEVPTASNLAAEDRSASPNDYREMDGEAYNDIYTPKISEESINNVKPANGGPPMNEEGGPAESKSLLVPTKTKGQDLSESGSYASSRKSSVNSDMMMDLRSGSYLELRSRKSSPKRDSNRTEFKWKGSDKLVSSEVIETMNRFKTKQPKGTIDVWWLFDDGGLTLLLPYILTTRSLWENSKLRIFCLCGKRGDLEKEHCKMSELIRKFRIDISDVIVIEGMHKRPSEESMKNFNRLIEKFRVKKDMPTIEENDKEVLMISEEELKSSQDKTRRHVRLKEILVEYSRDASLIVMTLPVPSKGRVSAPLYLAWLETLTKDLPPFLLVRGNQTSVLTFYS